MRALFKQNVFLISVLAFTILFSQTVFSGHRMIHDSMNKTYAQNSLPNLRFGSINVESRKGTYDIIAFKEYNYFITLFAENADAKNVHVRAGIVEGNVFYEKTFPYLSTTAPKRIEFAYIMPIGAHTMYIEVDPEDTIAELDESDNRVTRTFISDLRINVR